jgi:hypothetical protein
MRISPPRKQAWPFAISNIVDHAKFYSRSHAAVIRVYDDAGDVIETHEHAGEFKEPWALCALNKKPPRGEGVTAGCEMLLSDCWPLAAQVCSLQAVDWLSVGPQ